ncbi:MAG TPA: dihydrodipicolinate synthase family protein [Alphaproteobacteria bacterium]|nr:dihydrodipicolinate synthase family protein [Alphaproteobacteria bacterium]
MAAKLSTFCCSVTPFDEKGRLDLEAAEAHFARVADAGVCLYVGGSSPGEGYSFSEQEMKDLLKIGVKAAGGKVSVRAMGVEPRNAEQMVKFLKLAADTGVDACQIYSLDVGHGWKPGTIELEAYYRAALEACPLPAIISSHAFMGYNAPIDLLERLANEYDNLIGINLTTPDYLHLTEAIARLRPRLEIHVGGPMNTLTALALGANGYLSSEAAIAPKLCRSVIAHWEEGRLEDAFKAYGNVMAIMVGLNSIPGASVRRLKGAQRLLGRPGSYLRSPFAPLTEAELDMIGKALDKLAARPGIEELAWH